MIKILKSPEEKLDSPEKENQVERGRKSNKKIFKMHLGRKYFVHNFNTLK
jgi:hypothetical protein